MLFDFRSRSHSRGAEPALMHRRADPHKLKVGFLKTGTHGMSLAEVLDAIVALEILDEGRDSIDELTIKRGNETLGIRSSEFDERLNEELKEGDQIFFRTSFGHEGLEPGFYPTATVKERKSGNLDLAIGERKYEIWNLESLRNIFRTYGIEAEIEEGHLVVMIDGEPSLDLEHPVVDGARASDDDGHHPVTVQTHEFQMLHDDALDLGCQDHADLIRKARQLSRRLLQQIGNLAVMPQQRRVDGS